jgi:GR25 family glycosyltransferase involved in LPS biosynthesis
MKRFVINLKRRPDRLEQFFTRCPYPRECINVIEAFDGKFQENESKKEKKYIPKFSNNRLRPGEIGVFISHLRIWKKMVNDNIPIAMVFEDDAQFDEKFYEFMETLSIPEHVNLLYFGGRFNKNFTIPPYAMEPVNDKIYKHITEPWDMRLHERTAHGYIITSRMAKFFISAFDIYDNDVAVLDFFMIHVLKRLNIPYHSTYPLVCWSPMVGDSDIR